MTTHLPAPDTAAQLRADLHRCVADIEREQRLLDAEGTVMPDGRANPRFGVVDTLTKRNLALLRAIRAEQMQPAVLEPDPLAFIPAFDFSSLARHN